MKKFTILIAALSLFLSCKGMKQGDQSIIIAVTGNSSPFSPFRPDFSSFKGLMTEISSSHPVVTIHMGNILYGGSKSLGITAEDMEMQNQALSEITGKRGRILHIIPGERDRYNGTLDFFEKLPGATRYSSLNCGGVHLIFLSSKDSDREYLDTEQLRWLKNDLQENRDIPYTIVFSHHRIFSQFRNRETSNRAEYLQNLFRKYSVTAVITGDRDRFRESEKDGVRYIETGCDNSPERKKHTGKNQFYLLTITNGSLNVEPCKYKYQKENR